MRKIEDRNAVGGVVGLGYVGLPFALEKAKLGYRVIGIEQNPVRAEKVNRGETYIRDVKDEELRELVESGLIRAEPVFFCVPEMDVVVICLPTPLTKNFTPDLQYVEKVTQEIAARLRARQLVSF